MINGIKRWLDTEPGLFELLLLALALAFFATL